MEYHRSCPFGINDSVIFSLKIYDYFAKQTLPNLHFENHLALPGAFSEDGLKIYGWKFPLPTLLTTYCTKHNLAVDI